MFEMKHPKELSSYPSLWMDFQVKEAITESDSLALERSEKSHQPLNALEDVAQNPF